MSNSLARPIVLKKNERGSVETDEHGILTESELENVKRAWIDQDPAVNYTRANWDDYGELMVEAAEAQHDHDVEVVQEALIPVDLRDERYQRGAEAMQRAILASLKAKAENAG